MNRQRNSWISEKGYTSCCTDPGFVSQIGVHIVSERGWTVDLWRQSCTEHFITLSPSWKIHAFPSAPMCDKGLCLPLFHHLFFLWDYWIQDTCRIWIISYIYFHSAVVFLGWFQFWPFYMKFASSLHTCVGLFLVLWSSWSWWTCVSCAKLVLLPHWGWFQPYANCQEGLIHLWFTCGLSNALQKWSSLSKHYANIIFFQTCGAGSCQSQQKWQETDKRDK